MTSPTTKPRRRFLGTAVSLLAAGVAGSACESTDGTPPVFESVENDDKPLSEAVRKSFENHAQTAPHPIKVSSEGDVVTLRGFVFTDAERDAAERIAQRVNGVRSVINLLLIR